MRAFVDGTLKTMARNHRDIVAEGRDMGTSVFPQAEVKIYLDADPEIRAMRRWKEHPELSYNDVLTDLKRRDEQDSSRDISPLTKSDDTLTIDNSYISVEQTLRILKNHIDNARFHHPRN